MYANRWMSVPDCPLLEMPLGNFWGRAACTHTIRRDSNRTAVAAVVRFALALRRWMHVAVASPGALKSARVNSPSLVSGRGRMRAMRPFLGGATVAADREIDSAWVARFHAGDKVTLTEVYQDHFDSVLATCRRFLREADAETCTQEVFLRMVGEPNFRENFTGGSPRAWLCTVARNRSIDTLRKRGREDVTEPQDLEKHAGAADGERFAEQAEARRIVEAFRKAALPAKWAPVFEARFMRQLTQREAAGALGMSRTTLAYQELRVRGAFEKFVLTHTRSSGGKA